MNSEVRSQLISNGETNNCTTAYENNAASVLFEPACERVLYDPGTCPNATPNQTQDPKFLNAFLQSMFQETSTVLQPQPILPVQYHHHLLRQECSSPPQPGHFERTPDDSFSSGCLSLQTFSDISGGDAYQVEGIPFGFTPLGALPAHLTSPLALNSFAPDSSFSHSIPDYYLSSPNISTHLTHPLQTPPDVQSVPEPRIGYLSGSSSVEPSGSYAGFKPSLPGRVLSLSEQERICSDESQLGSDLRGVELSLSACALVDRASSGFQPLQQPFSPTRSKKRSRSPTLGIDSAPGPSQPSFDHQTPEGHQSTGPGLEYQFCHDMDNESLSPSQGARVTPQTPFKHAKRHRKGIVPRRDRVFQSDQFITPCRPNVLSNITATQNILPPTPGSIERPGNFGQCGCRAEPKEDGKAHKLDKIRSIERALEAVETLSEYLSKEASEASAEAGKLESHSVGSPRNRRSASRLALGSPRDFLTLGELGGRLKRRLEVERR